MLELQEKLEFSQDKIIAVEDLRLADLKYIVSMEKKLEKYEI